MRQVYSFGMINHQGATGDEARVTVPHGFVFVVKMITVFSTPSFGTVGVFFRSYTSGCAFWHDKVTPLSELSRQVPLTIAFNEGEEFGFRVVHAIGDAADVYAGGYALTLP